MEGWPDWTVYLLGAALVLLFGWFFWYTGRSIIQSIRMLIHFVDTYPERRRAWAEAEARAGGRFPFWYRAVRVGLVVAMLVFAGLAVWFKVTAPS